VGGEPQLSVTSRLRAVSLTTPPKWSRARSTGVTDSRFGPIRMNVEVEFGRYWAFVTQIRRPS
jgi:hypothetical protein